jgi:hypothetical protein
MRDDPMSDELDDLFAQFAGGELAGQIGKAAPAFAKRRIRQMRRRRGVAMSLALVLVATFIAIPVREPGKGTGRAMENSAMAGSPVLDEQVWYRDVPGPMVVLKDHTPAQVIYRQVYQVRTSMENKTSMTEATPVELTLLVGRPVY